MSKDFIEEWKRQNKRKGEENRSALGRITITPLK